MSRRPGLLCLFVCAALTAACEKPINPNDLPVSHWADPKTIGADGVGYADACSVANAQAIVKSGLPFPNYGTKDEWDAGNKTMRKRITTVDYWLGGTRYVFPAEIASSSSYPLHNPHRYNALAGTLPHFYPKGEPAPNIDGMGAMVDVQFICSMEPRFIDSKGPRSTEEGIQSVKAAYELKAISKEVPGTVTVSKREDLGMTEILLDRKQEAHNQRYWEATYFPLNRELKDYRGEVSAIGCRTRHDPIQKRYGNVGHRCGSAMWVTANTYAHIQIYVSHVEQMPSIYDQIQQLIINAKKAGE